MNFIRKFLYLFFSEQLVVREYLGGRWYRYRFPDTEWNKTNALIDKYCGWPLNPDEYDCEEHFGKSVYQVLKGIQW